MLFRSWQRVERSFTTGDRPVLAPIGLFNKGGTPVWIDDVAVTVEK